MNATMQTPASGPTTLPTDRLWTVDETAYFLSMSTSWVRRSDLPYVLLGGGRRYQPRAVLQFVEQRSSRLAAGGAR
jgi:hypothetical protein